MLGYSAAVASSITIAYSLRRLSAKFTKTMSGGSMVLASSVINYLAVASAGFLNSYCMRRGEMTQGIAIQDEITGETIGTSKIAAR